MGDGSGPCGPTPAGPPVDLALKVAGVHWWFRTRSHAAELTAGELGGGGGQWVGGKGLGTTLVAGVWE